jgi:pimeloyl-ACP methyl ester carboxylesterase
VSGTATFFTRNLMAPGSNEYEVLVMPNDGSHVGKRGVIFCHGYTANGQNGVNWVTSPGLAQLLRQLAMRGIACVSADMGGNTFGNDLSMTRIGQARAFLAAQGCATDKVLFAADSMGNWLATRYAADNPGQVASILAVEPGIDLNAVRDANTLGAQADINLAWGLTVGSTSSTVPLPTNANLLARAAGGALTGLRYRAYYSTGDVVATPASVTTLVGAIGATADKVVVPGAPAHGFGVSAVVPHAAAADWLAYAA